MTASTRKFLDDQRTTRSLTITSSIEIASVTDDQPIIANPSKPAKRRVLKRKFMELHTPEVAHSKKTGEIQYDEDKQLSPYNG